ncbi:hypothetical protein LPJ59_006782, partial [Coemansia sp. RSA 2399]
MFPGVASALARIALAQAPKQTSSSSPENWRSPSAAVRARALDVFKTSLVVMYEHASGEQEDDLETSTSDMVADWAQRARQDVEHIINSLEEDSESVATKVSDGDNAETVDDSQRIQQVLWRLSGLRHVKTPRITRALLELFTAVALDCAALQPTKCLAVAIESCLVVAGAHPEDQASVDVLSRLAEECKSKADGVVSRQLSLQMESALPLFDRYIADGTDQQREDVLCLLSSYIRVLGPSRSQPLLASWWKARGLGSFLNSLQISLPGTSLLITEVVETSDTPAKAHGGSVEYVLDHYRGAALGRCLDQFVVQMSNVFTPTELCSQLLSLLLNDD